MKREAWNHPKFKLLAMDLRLPLCFVRGVMESLWLATAINWPRGDIGRWTNEEIAVSIDYPGDADELIAELAKRRLLDHIGEGRLYVHDWHDHADSHVHARLAKQTELFANGMPPRITHDAFNGQTRSRIAAEYARKYPALATSDHDVHGPAPDGFGACPGLVRDLSGTGPGKVPAIPEPEPEPEPEPDKEECTSPCGSAGEIAGAIIGSVKIDSGPSTAFEPADTQIPDEAGEEATTSPQTRNEATQTEWIRELWNARRPSELSACRDWTEKRHRLAKTRLREHPRREDWEGAIQALHESSFCKGGRGWRASIDWLLERPDSLTKLLEGVYADGRGNGSALCNDAWKDPHALDHTGGLVIR